jgi:hypothetical protein
VLVSFRGGDVGRWRVERIATVTGAPLPPAARIAMIEGVAPDLETEEGAWTLRGAISEDRYVTARERTMLSTLQPPLGRSTATAAALIPITKSAEWWSLPQDARRAIFEERSHHIARSLAYLPRIARRLHHGRDLGEQFDFLTWFEFAPADASAFDELVGMLRATEEWRYVEREVEIRMLLAEFN